MSGWRAIMSDVNYGISNVGTVMTACAGSQAGQLGQYHAKLDRVKFGAPLEQVCRPDLPGPLLVSLSSDQRFCNVDINNKQYSEEATLFKLNKKVGTFNKEGALKDAFSKYCVYRCIIDQP